MTGGQWFWKLDDHGRPVVYRAEALASGGHPSERAAWEAVRLAHVRRRREASAVVKRARDNIDRLKARR